MHLPAEAASIVVSQGWSDETIALNLLGFIQHNVPDYEKQLKIYFQACADEGDKLRTR